VEYPNDTTYTNAAGCMALAFADAGGAECAAAVEADIRCRNASCSPNCPNGSTAAGLAEIQQCESVAEMTNCATQGQAANACFSDPTYAACVFADSEANFIGLGEFFCAAGAGAADGGSDAPSDASADGE